MSAYDPNTPLPFLLLFLPTPNYRIQKSFFIIRWDVQYVSITKTLHIHVSEIHHLRVSMVARKVSPVDCVNHVGEFVVLL